MLWVLLLSYSMKYKFFKVFLKVFQSTKLSHSPIHPQIIKKWHQTKLIASIFFLNPKNIYLNLTFFFKFPFFSCVHSTVTLNTGGINYRESSKEKHPRPAYLVLLQSLSFVVLQEIIILSFFNVKSTIICFWIADLNLAWRFRILIKI